jgi:hypothetical protein
VTVGRKNLFQVATCGMGKLHHVAAFIMSYLQTEMKSMDFLKNLFTLFGKQSIKDVKTPKTKLGKTTEGEA